MEKDFANFGLLLNQNQRQTKNYEYNKRKSENLTTTLTREEELLREKHYVVKTNFKKS
jgi:hypothetical protein